MATLFLKIKTLPGGLDGKESACDAGDPGLIPGLRRSPGEGNGNPLQYSCQENPPDRRTWTESMASQRAGPTERLTYTQPSVLTLVPLIGMFFS